MQIYWDFFQGPQHLRICFRVFSPVVKIEKPQKAIDSWTLTGRGPRGQALKQHAWPAHEFFLVHTAFSVVLSGGTSIHPVYHILSPLPASLPNPGVKTKPPPSPPPPPPPPSPFLLASSQATTHPSNVPAPLRSPRWNISRLCRDPKLWVNWTRLQPVHVKYNAPLKTKNSLSLVPWHGGKEQTSRLY